MNAIRATLLIVLFSISAPIFCDELTPEKRADTEHLLEMTGALAIGQQMSQAMVGQMTQLLRQARPDIPQRVLDVLPVEVNAVISANVSSLKEIMIVLYHKHFTGSEIKGLIKFYSTELGQKTVRVMPMLVSDSIKAGQQWGEALGPSIEQRIKARFKKEGYEL